MKANWVGHVLRRNCLTEDITQEKIEGKRKRGRRTIKTFGDIKEESFYDRLKRNTWDRVK